jgi:hypothetical protein
MLKDGDKADPKDRWAKLEVRNAKVEVDKQLSGKRAQKIGHRDHRGNKPQSIPKNLVNPVE